MKANAMKVYWAETDSGQKMEWPKGLLVVSLGEHDYLQKALWKYGKHLASCHRNIDIALWCDCGWDKIRETLSPPPALNPEKCVHGRTRDQDCPHCPGSFQSGFTPSGGAGE